MNDIAARAVAAATFFEAKKTGFGQAQDGWSLTLRISHLDVPPSVRDAPKGTRYQVAIVEIDDSEEPVLRESPPLPDTLGGANVDPVSSVPAAPGQTVGASPVDNPTAEQKVRRKLREMPYPQRAGMLVGDELFRRYMRELGHSMATSHDGADAVLKAICGVMSKTELATNIEAAERFQELEDGYRAYRASGEYARVEA